MPQVDDFDIDLFRFSKRRECFANVVHFVRAVV